MKKLICCLGASLMAVSGLVAIPSMTNCKCQNCACSQEAQCGCLSKVASQECKCSENCLCGSNCACESNCECK